MRLRLEQFGMRINVPPDERGVIWLISPRELRRFFATAWVWYYELGDGLDALKQHLRHTDINTTLIYARSLLQGTNLSEEQKLLTLEIMEKAAFDWIDLRGPGGKRLIENILADARSRC